MNKRNLLIKLLYCGLLEIRALSASSDIDSLERINLLANILHNLPKALENDDTLKQLDFELLKKETERYKLKYQGSILKY